MEWVFDARPTLVPSENPKGEDPVEKQIAAYLAKMSMHGDSTGTFRLDGDSIVMHWDTYKQQVSGVSLKVKQKLEQSDREDNKRTLELFNKGGAGQIKWIDSDHFTLKAPGAHELDTFTRVKPH